MFENEKNFGEHPTCAPPHPSKVDFWLRNCTQLWNSELTALPFINDEENNREYCHDMISSFWQLFCKQPIYLCKLHFLQRVECCSIHFNNPAYNLNTSHLETVYHHSRLNPGEHQYENPVAFDNVRSNIILYSTKPQ